MNAVVILDAKFLLLGTTFSPIFLVVFGLTVDVKVCRCGLQGFLFFALSYFTYFSSPVTTMGKKPFRLYLAVNFLLSKHFQQF